MAKGNIEEAYSYVSKPQQTSSLLCSVYMSYLYY